MSIRTYRHYWVCVCRSLYENEIGNKGAEYLKEGLKNCATLNKLVLSYNLITDEVWARRGGHTICLSTYACGV